jgi:hypothetical protein
VYPALISSIENKDMNMIAEALAQIKHTNTRTSNYHSTLPTPSPQDHIPSSSPTPIDPIPPPNRTAAQESDYTPIMTQKQDEEGGQMIVTTINPGNQVHTVWDDDTPGNIDIFYKRDGADYDPTTVNLSRNDGTSIDAAIAVEGNNVHIVWSNNPGDILYSRSIDSGASFGPEINLSNNPGSSGIPAIAVSGNNVHVVWQDTAPDPSFDILYRRSIDGGASFTDPIKQLSSTAGSSISPAIAAVGNSVHVVWEDDTAGNDEILYRRSLDGGTTFPNVIKNLSSNSEDSVSPAIAAVGNSVHVVWSDASVGNGDIFYRRSLDDGTTFPNVIKNLSSNAGTSGFPAIAASGNNVHVVWQDATSDPALDILYRRSLDNGTTFPNVIKNLSSNAGTSSFPAIAVSGNNVYAVWEDTPILSSTNEILYRTSANNGNTFPAVSTNLSTNDGNSLFPAIAVS